MARKSPLAPEIVRMLNKEIMFPPGQIDASTIKRFARAIGDRNPLFNDEKFAQNTLYGGLIAPPTLIFSINLNAWDEIGDDGRSLLRVTLPPPLKRAIRAGNEYYFFQPLHTGQTIYKKTRISDIYEKVGKRAGPMVFVVTETHHTNQNEELLGINRETLIFPQGNMIEEASNSAKLAPPLPPQPAMEDDMLPPLTKEITLVQLVMYSGAIWNFYRLHYDKDFSQSQGYPNANVHGSLLGAFLAQLMTDWMGMAGKLRKLSFSLRKMSFPGDTLTCKGIITGRYVEEGEERVDTRLWIENQNGEITTTGSATAVLRH